MAAWAGWVAWAEWAAWISEQRPRSVTNGSPAHARRRAVLVSARRQPHDDFGIGAGHRGQALLDDLVRPARDDQARFARPAVVEHDTAVGIHVARCLVPAAGD